PLSFSLRLQPPISTLFPYTTLFRSRIGFKKEMRSFLLTDVYKKPTGLHRTYEYLELLQQYTGKAIEHVTVGLIPPSFATPNQLRSEEHTSELQSRENLVCRLLLENK